MFFKRNNNTYANYWHNKHDDDDDVDDDVCHSTFFLCHRRKNIFYSLCKFICLLFFSVWLDAVRVVIRVENDNVISLLR